MDGVTDVDRRPDSQLVRWIIIGSPPAMFAIEFVYLYVTYLVTRSLAPDLLGEVVARPAAFAALIALVALPMHIALAVAFVGKALKEVLTGAEPPAAPVRTGWHRLGANLVSELPNVAAALIVLGVFADLSAAPWAPLLAITILGPIALSWSLRGLGALSRWGRRHWANRGYQPQHMAPDDRLTAADGDSERKGSPG
jgi:hypothetical protein